MSNYRHGHAMDAYTKRSKTYIAWQNMIARCCYESYIQYKDYGGRGIKICASWLISFYYFLYDMGECPEGMTLDRRDNNGHYTPSNCRWVTRKVNSRNTRRNRFLTYKGETKTVAEWEEIAGLNSSCLKVRLQCGWTLEEALTIPLGQKRKFAVHSDQ